MDKKKVKVKKVPMGKGGSPNFNEMAYQYTTNYPLHFKNAVEEVDGNQEFEIGKSYPIEKDPEKANIEAEKGELILTKEYELYKIHGKDHSKGGSPISANEGDFIFSKRITSKGDAFDKIFGKFDPKKEYSFAEVAEKFIDMNEFKVLMESKNPLDRKTGLMMFEEYRDKLGMLAFLQETVKGLPNGIPSISAPMMEKMVQQPEGSASETIMKKGGSILKQYAPGGEAWIAGEPPRGVIKKRNEAADSNSGVQRLGNEWWKNNYYRPTLEFLRQKDPILPDFSTHKDYQEAVIRDPELKAELIKQIKEDKMPLTDYGRELLTKKLGKKKAYDISSYSELPEDLKNDDEFLLQQYIDGLPGHRGVDVPGARKKRGFLSRMFKGPNDPAYSAELNPQEGDPSYSGYRDLGYNTNEHAALFNAMGAMYSLPYYAPTRMQNYGLQEGLGLASNVMPYNYQSMINEANRVGYRGMNANNAISPNANIASARNAIIAGQMAEQGSKIKGEEYNQNANLYNNNQMQLAEFASKIGLDKEQQGELYNNKVTQSRENFWANKKMATKEFLMEFANANNNRRMRNTVDYLMASRDPNYRFKNSDLSAGFMSLGNPFDLLSTNVGNPNNMTGYTDAGMQSRYSQLMNMYPNDKSMVTMIMRKEFGLGKQPVIEQD